MMQKMRMFLAFLAMVLAGTTLCIGRLPRPGAKLANASA